MKVLTLVEDLSTGELWTGLKTANGRLPKSHFL